jgi:hypothetical protein
VCIAGESAACNKALQQYTSDREQYLKKYGESHCQVDGDCRLVFEDNSCVSNCGEALPVSTASFFESNIQPDATACNNACLGLSGKPDCMEQVAVCSNGLCVAVPRGSP